jgi:hypothetical protein
LFVEESCASRITESRKPLIIEHAFYYHIHHRFLYILFTMFKIKEVANMDTQTKNTLRTGVTKSIKVPETLQVEESAVGMPVAVRLNRHHTVVTVEDMWRIDDEWRSLQMGASGYVTKPFPQ